MLRINNKVPNQEVSVEFGDYVPFKFQFSEMARAPQLYWRAGDMDSTLFELGIDSESGVITSGTLLLSGEIKQQFPSLTGLDNSSLGVPTISIEDWPDNRYNDDTLPFQVFADLSRLLILFSETCIADKCIVSSKITFGVSNDSSLVWIMFNEGNLDAATEVAI